MPTVGPGIMRCGLVLGLLAFGSVPRPAPAQDAYFPGGVFLPDDKEVNTIIDEMRSVHLRAMEEPSLWKLSQADRDAVAYRFLWLHPGSPQIAIRIARSGKAFVLHVAEHDGPPGTTAGKLSLRRDIRLTEAEGQKLVGLIEGAKFWTLPVYVRESMGIADGDALVIEGVKGGCYHVLERAGSSTGEALKAFCRTLLERAGEPDVLKEWDRMRQAERSSPRYRPEPPQTEYRGTPFVPLDEP